MERSDWDDDEEYPSAPVPPHERTWRHPSEMAQIDWRTSEPPLAIGRGLMIATGTVGALLSIAVLWAMLPAAGGGGPSAASVTVTGRFVSTSAIAERPSSSPSAAITASTGRATVPASTISAATSVTEVPDPVPTVHVTSAETVANAVLLTGGLIVTTVGAVGEQLEVTVDDGTASLAARVLLIDDDAGVAVLMPSSESNASQYEVAGCSPGDQVKVLDDEPFDAAVTEAADGRFTLTAEGTAMEGTPVVDADGYLVGLYSLRGDGVRLVRVDHLRRTADTSTTTTTTTAEPGPTVTTVAAATAPTSPATSVQPSTLPAAAGQSASTSTTVVATSTTTRPPPVWLGLQVSETDGGVRIDLVASDGPAAGAGLLPGDVITEVDGSRVANAADVADQLARKVPGDRVVVGYTRGNWVAEINVTLAVRPAV